MFKVCASDNVDMYMVDRYRREACPKTRLHFKILTETVFL